MQIKEITKEIEVLEQKLHSISAELEKLRKLLPKDGRLHALRHGKTYQYYMRNGLRVRSKSEILIADILDEMSIPFLYEKPLLLSSGLYHPDFTLLNIKERKEVYWEHFGMMDDMDYRNSAFKKIRRYEASGLFHPDSFLWTFETGRYPLETKPLRRMVNELKINLGY